MFESRLEEALGSTLLAVEVDAAGLHTVPSVDRVIAAGENDPITPALLGRMQSLDLSTLTLDQRIGVSVFWQRVANHAEAQRGLAVVATVQTCPDSPQMPRELHASSQLEAALGVGSGAMGGMIVASTQLAERLPVRRRWRWTGTCAGAKRPVWPPPPSA